MEDSIVNIEYRNYGGNRASVVLLPALCGQRFVFLSVNNNTGGWAVRDFITNRLLVNERSEQSWQNIEHEVQYSEYPPFYNVDDHSHFAHWELYLILRTIAHYQRNDQQYDIVPPNPAFGMWVAISRNWQALQL